jgi:predicted TIM-barrel fold metal-dependent hydrolase
MVESSGFRRLTAEEQAAVDESLRRVGTPPPEPTIHDVDLQQLFLPDPQLPPPAYTVISVDDHVLEHPHVFEGRLPRRYEDRAPRVVETERGSQAWLFDGQLRHEYLRPACYDVHERVRDMDLAGMWASLNFPSFVSGFAGRVFSQASDFDLGLAVTIAWNDWLHEEWYSEYPDRFIPLCIVPLTDPEAAVRELVRNAERGCRAVALPELPERIGLPSPFSDYWDPIVRACADTGTVICLHVGSSGGSDMPPEIPPLSSDHFALSDTLFGHLSHQATAEWLIAGWAHRYPEVQFAISEGGIGWVAMLIDRLDNVLDHSPYGDAFSFPERPSDLLRRNFNFCSLNDPSTAVTIGTVGVENVMVEVDYPHGDTSWPDTQELLRRTWGGHPPATIRAVCSENAARVFRHPLPPVVLPAG